jgi:hypothetical protein
MSHIDKTLGDDRLGPAGDLFYDKLLKTHAGLSEEESVRLNMRLVLLMANMIGDGPVLSAILDTALSAGKERS